jgi:sugar phosphate isomerase/epimerase
MRVSLSTGCLYCYPLKSVFRLAKEAGFDGLELVISPEVVLRGSGYITTLAESSGLEIYSMHPPLFPYPGWSDLPRLIPKAAKLALELECPILVVHPPKTESMDSFEGERYVRRMLEATNLLKGTVTRLCLENPAVFRPRDHRYALHNPVALRAFADRYDLPVTLDTAHAGSGDFPLGELCTLMDGRLVNVHFSDLGSPPRALDRPVLYTYLKHHQLPGEGYLPLGPFLHQLAGLGYDGPITLELSPVSLRVWWPPAVRRNLARSVAYIRDCLGSAPSPQEGAG